MNIQTVSSVMVVATLLIGCGKQNSSSNTPPAKEQTSPAGAWDQVLVRSSSKLNKKLPQMMDKETRMDTTTAGPGNQFTYFYTIVTLSNQNFNTTKFVGAMKPRLVNLYKTDPPLETFRKHQVELHHIYRNQSGNTVGTIDVSTKDF